MAATLCPHAFSAFFLQTQMALKAGDLKEMFKVAALATIPH
jgi:hypothetical protein